MIRALLKQLFGYERKATVVKGSPDAAENSISGRGRARYQELKELLERDHLDECIQINVATGEYVLAESYGELHRLFREKFGNVPSWDTRIGRPTLVDPVRGLLDH